LKGRSGKVGGVADRFECDTCGVEIRQHDPERDSPSVCSNCGDTSFTRVE
jgi:predicted RNA-binding Zn-ribbon protein involved in translation (DUF1610 family)